MTVVYVIMMLCLIISWNSYYVLAQSSLLYLCRIQNVVKKIQLLGYQFVCGFNIRYHFYREFLIMLTPVDSFFWTLWSSHLWQRILLMCRSKSKWIFFFSFLFFKFGFQHSMSVTMRNLPILHFKACNPSWSSKYIITTPPYDLGLCFWNLEFNSNF